MSEEMRFGIKSNGVLIAKCQYESDAEDIIKFLEGFKPACVITIAYL